MKNLIAAAYAPMDPKGLLNLDIIGDYLQFLKTNRIAGAFVNGSTGDFVSLSTDERKELISAWAKYKSRDFAVINHVGHTNLNETRHLAEHSQGLVDAICVLPPYYFRLKSLESLVYYCKRIAGGAPSTPFYYYHIPVLTGTDFPMIDFLKMVEDEIPNFAGIKYSKYDMSDFKECLEHRSGAMDILFGVDEKMATSLEHGAYGWVGSTYNHMAPLYYEIMKRYARGEYEMVKELQEKALFFVHTLDALAGFNGAGKSFMRLFGIDMGPSRFPHTTLDNDQLSMAIKALDKKGLLPYLSQPFSQVNLST